MEARARSSSPLPGDAREIVTKHTVGVSPAVPLSVPYPEDYRQAIERVVNKDQVKSMKLTSQRLRAVRAGAYPQLLQFNDLLLNRLDKVGIPAWSHCIVRTAAVQAQLRADGFSKVRFGAHMAGLATDIVHSIYAWDMSPEEWSFFGAIGKELAKQRGIPIQWGGDWPPLVKGVGWDPAHWQIKGWKALATGYPFK